MPYIVQKDTCVRHSEISTYVVAPVVTALLLSPGRRPFVIRKTSAPSGSRPPPTTPPASLAKNGESMFGSSVSIAYNSRRTARESSIGYPTATKKRSSFGIAYGRRPKRKLAPSPTWCQEQVSSSSLGCGNLAVQAVYGRSARRYEPEDFSNVALTYCSCGFLRKLLRSADLTRNHASRPLRTILMGTSVPAGPLSHSLR
jgi:hypothetical protein